MRRGSHAPLAESHTHCTRAVLAYKYPSSELLLLSVSVLKQSRVSLTMGKMKGNKEGGKKGNGEGGNKDEGSLTIVLKVDMDCAGCASKVIKSVKDFKGVESVQPEIDKNKLTVVGKVDPSKLRDKVEQQTKKKVELISPSPKKEKDNAGGDKKHKDDEKPEKKKSDDKKSKELPVTTVVLKMSLHCEGCIGKIRRAVHKTEGVQNLTIDKPKDLLTVKGSMDAKALAESLKERFRRPVDIVPAKKDGGGGGDKKEKGSGGGGDNGENKEKGSGGGGGGGGGGKKEQGAEAGKAEGSRMEYMGPMPGYGYGYGYGYPPGNVVEHLHAPQMFSDENPNACFVM